MREGNKERKYYQSSCQSEWLVLNSMGKFGKLVWYTHLRSIHLIGEDLRMFVYQLLGIIGQELLLGSINFWCVQPATCTGRVTIHVLEIISWSREADVGSQESFWTQWTGYGSDIGNTCYIVICRMARIISSMTSTHLIQCPKPPCPNGILLDHAQNQASVDFFWRLYHCWINTLLGSGIYS